MVSTIVCCFSTLARELCTWGGGGSENWDILDRSFEKFQISPCHLNTDRLCFPNKSEEFPCVLCSHYSKSQGNSYENSGYSD